VVLGVIEWCIATPVDWTRYTELGVLGLDEMALKKGHLATNGYGNVFQSKG
jgi:hypothetical protein